MSENLDLSDEIAEVEVCFKVTGLSWDHPRVKSWLNRCGFDSRHHITAAGYNALVRSLRNLLNEIHCAESKTNSRGISNGH